MQDETQLIAEEFRRRAKSLAVVATSNEKKDESREREIEVMPFLLGSETYAVAFEYVQKIHPLEVYIPIPGTPDYILGVTSISGSIYSVTDLKILFNLPAGGLTNLNKLIIIGRGDFYMGILADEVMGAVSLTEEEIGPIDSWDGTDRKYIQGVTKDRLILIDIEKFLNDPNMIVDTAKKT